MRKNSSPKNYLNYFLFIICIVLVLVLGYAIVLVYFRWPISLINIQNGGVFGDSFGILTSLFSGVALAGIVVALYMQQEELDTQHESVRLQSDELALTRKEISKQSFEASLFHMMKFHNEYTTSLSIGPKPSPTHRGKDCFNEWKRILEIKTDSLSGTGETVDKWMEDHLRPKLENYLNLTYVILEWVNNNHAQIEEEESQKYFQLIKAMLSESEMELILLLTKDDQKWGDLIGTIQLK